MTASIDETTTSGLTLLRDAAGDPLAVRPRDAGGQPPGRLDGQHGFAATATQPATRSACWRSPGNGTPERETAPPGPHRHRPRLPAGASSATAGSMAAARWMPRGRWPRSRPRRRWSGRGRAGASSWPARWRRRAPRPRARATWPTRRTPDMVVIGEPTGLAAGGAGLQGPAAGRCRVPAHDVAHGRAGHQRAGDGVRLLAARAVADGGAEHRPRAGLGAGAGIAAALRVGRRRHVGDRQTCGWASGCRWTSTPETLKSLLVSVDGQGRSASAARNTPTAAEKNTPLVRAFLAARPRAGRRAGLRGQDRHVAT